MLHQIPSSRLELSALRGLLLCDSEQLPFADRSFDYVVNLRFFHLGIPVASALAILREFTRIARKGLIIHMRLKEPNLLAKISGTIPDLLSSPRDAPAEMVNKAKKGLAIARTLVLRNLPKGPTSHSAIQEPSFFALCRTYK